ncbi:MULTISPECIES: hypothetical protein [Streptomyces]|uniref:hypothetical protein n=1 Tax=Streptomyces TaxID=1883 RepID=UPI0022498276|nr:hypothetical protein [Streptomyces sp. JHD 1]MCX2969355.1 hypothetical protein [Streptomyces sp. JHD 1]
MSASPSGRAFVDGAPDRSAAYASPHGWPTFYAEPGSPNATACLSVASPRPAVTKVGASS